MQSSQRKPEPSRLPRMSWPFQTATLASSASQAVQASESWAQPGAAHTGTRVRVARSVKQRL